MNIAVNNLVKRFHQIGMERIQGLPIYNDSLSVEAIDFQSCSGGQIGALITPWFLNVILLPDDTHPWQFQELGNKVKYQLDSGEQEFIIGEDEEVGHYLFRTITSPTNCYKTQASAQSSAKKALSDLLSIPTDEVNTEIKSQQVTLTSSKSADSSPDQGRRDFIRKFVPS